MELSRLMITSGVILFVTAVQAQAQVQARLVDGLNEREGRVEIFYDGQWGSICDDGWENTDAAVICRMVGYTGLARAFQGGVYAQGTGLIHLRGVTCDGNEASIDICSHGGWGNVGPCTHAEDAGVICLGPQIPTTTTSTSTTSTTSAPPRICNNPSPDVRLVGGPNEALGQVQVRSAGQWWAVCDDRWGQAEAAVICKMLCYNPVNARAVGNEFGNVTAPYLLDDVDCVGNEDDILSCSSVAPNDIDCDYDESAGVSCLQDSPTPPPLPEPDVECSNEEIVAKFPLSQEPRLEEQHLNVTNFINCEFTTSRDSTHVSITIAFMKCDTERSLNRTHIIYSNVVRMYVPPSDPTITRTEVYNIPVFCVIPRTNDPSNEVEPEGRTAKPQFGDGEFDTILYIYADNRFTQPVQSFPVKVTLGDWVSAAVILRSDDTDLKLIVPQCWATPEADMNSTPQQQLISDRCAVEDSVTFYPINETMFAFRFQSFRFQGGNFSFFYIHCEAFVCGMREKDEQCDRTCETNSRRKRDINTNHHKLFYMEQGPFVFIAQNSAEDNMNKPDAPSDVNNGGSVGHNEDGGQTSSTSVIQVAFSLLLSALLALIIQ